MTWNTLQVEIGPVTTVRLARPEKRNAQSLEMWDELRRVGLSLEDDPTVRVVVLAGAGHSFSAGIDLSVLLSAKGPADLPDAELVQQAFGWLREARFATLALVQGYALGAGLQLALACDLRILADDAVLALPEIGFGIFPDVGGCAWLPGLVGPARAKEMAFTGDRIDASKALAWGLANQVVPRDELNAVGMALAARLAGQAPLGIAAAKRAIAAAEISSARALQVSAEEIRRCLASEDFREAGRAATEKRTARFQGK